jgi:hypothetical protein
MSPMRRRLNNMTAVQSNSPSHQISGWCRCTEQERPDRIGLLDGQRRHLVDDLPNMLDHPFRFILPSMVGTRQHVLSDGVTAMLIVRQMLGHSDTLAAITHHRLGEPVQDEWAQQHSVRSALRSVAVAQAIHELSILHELVA